MDNNKVIVLHILEPFLPNMGRKMISLKSRDEIYDEFYKVITKYNKYGNYIDLQVIEKCAIEINSLINIIKLKSGKIYSRLISYSCILFKNPNLDIEQDYILANSMDTTGDNSLYGVFIHEYKIWKNTFNLDTTEYNNHLSKYLYNIDDSEHLISNIKIKFKFKNWLNEFIDSDSQELVDLVTYDFMLTKSMSQDVKNQSNLFYRVSYKKYEELSEKITNFFWAHSILIDDFKPDLVKYTDLRSGISKSIKIPKISDKWENELKEMMDISKEIEFVSKTLPLPEEVMDKALKIESFLEYFGKMFKGDEKIIMEDAHLLSKKLSYFIHIDKPYDKYWIIHEFLQASGAPKLTKSKEGFTDNGFKHISDISKLRVQELNRKYKLILP